VLFVKKIPQNDAQAILQTFFGGPKPSPKRFTQLLETGLSEKRTACAHTSFPAKNCWFGGIFVTLNPFKKFKIKFKTYSGEWPNQGLSNGTNLHWFLCNDAWLLNASHRFSCVLHIYTDIYKCRCFRKQLLLTYFQIFLKIKIFFLQRKKSHVRSFVFCQIWRKDVYAHSQSEWLPPFLSHSLSSLYEAGIEKAINNVYMYCHIKIILENVLEPTLNICLGNYQDFLNYYNSVGNVPILLSFLLNRTKGQQFQSCVL
jgi:hypothetical protein